MYIIASFALLKLADFQPSGNIPLAKELLNIIEIWGAIKSAQSVISRVDIPSRPAPLKRDNTRLLSVETNWKLSLRSESKIFLKPRAIVERYFTCQFRTNCGKVIIESFWQSGRIQTYLPNRGSALFVRNKLIDYQPHTVTNMILLKALVRRRQCLFPLDACSSSQYMQAILLQACWVGNGFKVMLTSGVPSPARNYRDV